MNRHRWLYALAFAFSVSLAAHATEMQQDDWKKDMGKEGPGLTATGWAGTPVSLDAVRGNSVTLAFWNADVAC